MQYHLEGAALSRAPEGRFLEGDNVRDDTLFETLHPTA